MSSQQLVPLLLACTLSTLALANTPERSVCDTLTVFGRPILSISAKAQGPVKANWKQEHLKLELKPLIDLDVADLVNDASSKMEDRLGLDHAKAKDFAKLFDRSMSWKAGEIVHITCAPDQPVTLNGTTIKATVEDKETAKAFCGIWFSASGNSAIRSGLSLN